MSTPSGQSLVIGVSLKMYFDRAQTLSWCRRVAGAAAGHPAVTHGAVELVVLPGFVELAAVAQIFEGTAIRLGAQDLFWEDAGAFTGEVSGAQLAQAGCSFVEIGHAERRRLFHEGDSVLQSKVAASVRNGLTPILCVGESRRGDSAEAAAECIAQLEAMAGPAVDAGADIRAVVAYEPEWAIGADRPASLEHIRAVCSTIRAWLDAHHALAGSRVIYGGSAGPGLLSELGSDTDGLFLGRFAHDPDAVAGVLDEALALVS